MKKLIAVMFISIFMAAGAFAAQSDTDCKNVLKDDSAPAKVEKAKPADKDDSKKDDQKSAN